MGRASRARGKRSRSSGSRSSVVARLITQANAVAESGRWADAERLYLELTRLRPEEASVFHNLGVCQLRQGRVQEAARAHWNAALRAPERTDFWMAFGELFRRLRFSTFDPAVADMAISCLTHPGLSPAPYRKVALSVVRGHPVVGPLMESTEGVTVSDLEALASEPLFLALLANVVAPDLAFEGLVARVRTALLSLAQCEGVGEAFVELAAAVAIQAHLTAHVLRVGAEEADVVRSLADQVADGFAEPVQAGATLGQSFALAVLAAYEPLASVKGLPAPEWEPGPGTLPCISGLWARTVVEPALHKVLGDAVPRLSGPEPGTSAAVAQQYEAHPYPRWARVDHVDPVAAPDLLARVVSGLSLADDSTQAAVAGLDAPRILVAGCGTGRQALEAALRFRNAEVVALDLSRASLGYAATGALRYQQERIRFLQADILTLGDWDERFDIVEAGGVLHHLADPVAGWTTLLGLLRPGGLMKVSLYSRLGRTAQSSAKETLASGGFSDSPESIREARVWLKDNLSSETYETIAGWRDFYSLDECRDLLFHAQEQAYGLDDIGRILTELNMDFLGFEAVEPGALELFLRDYGQEALVNLSAWKSFEETHTSTFAGMYHFWVCRKNG